MSDADSKAVSTVTVTRQHLSLSMWRLNKEARPDRLLILITEKNHTGMNGNYFHQVTSIVQDLNKLSLLKLNRQPGKRRY